MIWGRMGEKRGLVEGPLESLKTMTVLDSTMSQSRLHLLADFLLFILLDIWIDRQTPLLKSQRKKFWVVPLGSLHSISAIDRSFINYTKLIRI